MCESRLPLASFLTPSLPSFCLTRSAHRSPKYFCVQLVPTEKQLAALNAVRKKAQERQPAPYTATTG